jgi:hypothetical protein
MISDGIYNGLVRFQTHTIENVDEIWGTLFDKIDEFQDPIPVERIGNKTNEENST